ncbi:migration and invasion enhancer 1-like, partial [Asterias amurensis]|uniref:migration and invasion enhancer 1-like n=1 Tax=Asterias amurensis TaxID=7602 RepID=UPI003AB2F48A
GYYPRYRELQDDIKRSVPGAVVDGKVGRRSSFEVTLNGQVLFSKLKNGGFPVNKEIIRSITEYDGGDVVPVTHSASECTVL